MADAKLPGKDGALKTLPRYRSHKEVWALEISGIDLRADGSVALRFVEDFAPLTVEPKVVHRYMPITGDRLVVYADGYRSISPRSAFEDGYRPVDA